MSILSSYIRELEFSRRKDTGKMIAEFNLQMQQNSD